MLTQFHIYLLQLTSVILHDCDIFTFAYLFEALNGHKMYPPEILPLQWVLRRRSSTTRSCCKLGPGTRLTATPRWWAGSCRRRRSARCSTASARTGPGEAPCPVSPSPSEPLSCPSVADKGRPIKLGNLTFTWRAPPTDYGPIRFVASIALGEL